MSTRAYSSTVIPVPVSFAWKHLRDFSFPEKFFDSVESVTIEDDLPPTTVGATRVVTWKDGQTRTQRLLEVSDQYHRVVWEMEDSNPPAEFSACISTLQLERVTDTNSLFLKWSSDFSTDIPADLVLFEQRAYNQNLTDLGNHLVQLFEEAAAEVVSQAE
eukprot:TRINITY_DN2750_c0_g2_i1.p1 TRINITY_DN2750_c0_g2~~TRINITY_DN2750_c0_g2_i1.p1  ORF type:complete len:178 (-),score=35.72 TRINITY_DN2750_c0_g2_i1:25-504(-)